MPQTLRLGPSEVAKAAQILRGGGLVAFPTETVYGLGASALDGAAVARVYAAKGRPSFNPLIVHVPSLEAARQLAEVPEKAEVLGRSFWPGALTLVLPLRASSGLSELVTAGLDTVAIRVPSHPIAQAILAQAGPVAAPSANVSGRISPTTAQHVLAGLDGRIDAVLDGGPCAVGLESTIVGVSQGLTLLRPGGLAAEEIAAVAGKLGAPGQGITAPGQLASHYAPSASVQLNTGPREGAVHLGFGPGEADLNLSEAGDLVEAAANLFGHLHELDAMGKPITVAPIPEEGLGRAINDRLRRAAAPRDR